MLGGLLDRTSPIRYSGKVLFQLIFFLSFPLFFLLVVDLKIDDTIVEDLQKVKLLLCNQFFGVLERVIMFCDQVFKLSFLLIRELGVVPNCCVNKIPSVFNDVVFWI